jgi:AraC-like DNA-binding protein
VAEGSCLMHTHKKSYIAEKGDICITHPNEYHTFVKPQNEDTPFTICSFSLLFEKKDINYDKNDIDPIRIIELLNNSYKLHDEDGYIFDLFVKLKKEFESKKPGYTLAADGLLSVLIIKIFQLLLPDKSSKSAKNIMPVDSIRETMIELFFLNNYLENPSVNDLANQLNICPRRVSQIINNMYSCSFSKKLADTRLEVAKYLLLYSTHTESEISDLCGFNSLNYFYTLFRKTTGISPNQFRNSSSKISR